MVTGLLAWLFGGSRPRAAAPPRDGDDIDATFFVCTTCGRTDLPEAGDWDPPICLECDAAINFDALEEEAWQAEHDGD